MPSTQRPWWHGSGEQSSTLSSHNVPSKPVGSQDQALPTCQGPVHSTGSNQSCLSFTSGLAHRARKRRAQFRPCPSQPPLHPALGLFQDSPLAKTLPVKSHSQLWPRLQFLHYQRCSAKGDTQEVPGDTVCWIPPFQLPVPNILPDPLAPSLALPQLKSTVGSAPWLPGCCCP